MQNIEIGMINLQNITDLSFLSPSDNSVAFNLDNYQLK